MSKQASATAHWEERKHMANIERMLQRAMDYSYPAGQAQAGLQMALVEVPWLLEKIAELKERINGLEDRAQPLRKATGL